MGKKNETNYSVSIKETSIEKMSAKDRIMMKDISDAIKLDEVVTSDEALIINPIAFAVLDIHNEKSDDKDYENYLIIAEEGKYVTGSNSFWSAFRNIFDELNGSGEEWSLKVFKLPSKNYSGKEFITCSVM